MSSHLSVEDSSDKELLIVGRSHSDSSVFVRAPEQDVSESVLNTTRN